MPVHDWFARHNKLLIQTSHYFTKPAIMQTSHPVSSKCIEMWRVLELDYYSDCVIDNLLNRQKPWKIPLESTLLHKFRVKNNLNDRKLKTYPLYPTIQDLWAFHRPLHLPNSYRIWWREKSKTIWSLRLQWLLTTKLQTNNWTVRPTTNNWSVKIKYHNDITAKWTSNAVLTPLEYTPPERHL